MQSECNQYNCCNCGDDLLPFVTRDNRHEGYCSNHSCNFSTNYDLNYTNAWHYFKNNNENVGGFRFEGEKTIEDVETIKPTTYTTCLKF